jgi:hypothetical protein
MEWNDTQMKAVCQYVVSRWDEYQERSGNDTLDISRLRFEPSGSVGIIISTYDEDEGEYYYITWLGTEDGVVTDSKWENYMDSDYWQEIGDEEDYERDTKTINEMHPEYLYRTEEGLVYEFPWDIQVGKGWAEDGHADIMDVQYVPIGERDYQYLCNLNWCPGEYKYCTQWQVSIERSGDILVIPMAPDYSSPYDNPFWEVYDTEYEEVLRVLRSDEYHLD